jgi:hypothetical protein
VFDGCLSLFYDQFTSMEEQGFLNRDDETHIWCLHYIFLPIINQHIKNWRDAWIHHPIRTEKNRTPFQLWVTGLQMARRAQAHNIVEPIEVLYTPTDTCYSSRNTNENMIQDNTNFQDNHKN